MTVTPVNPSPRRSREDAGRPGGGLAPVRGVRGVGDHHERGDARRDRAAVGDEAGCKRGGAGADLHGRVVGRPGGEAEPGEVLESRGDATVQQAGREGRHVLGGPRRHGREAAVLRSDEGSGDARHVRHRRQVDVDPEPLERRRRVVPTAADRGLAETAQVLCRCARRRPAEPAHGAALLVGHHEERIAAGGGRGSERGRERAHLRGVADVRAHQDHPADLSSADTREERLGSRRAVHPHDEARAHELRERGRRRVGRRGRAGCEASATEAGCGEGPTQSDAPTCIRRRHVGVGLSPTPGD